MLSDVRVVLLTSEALRHRYAACRVAAGVDLVGVVTETKAPAIVPDANLAPEDAAVLRRHLAERDEVERSMLGEHLEFPDAERLRVPHGGVNDPAICRWIERHDPHVVLLYGTSIVRAPLLDRYADRLVNLHLGLSPYYRGSGTNFWPLVHGEPECVGATIHVVAAAVDAGSVLAQVRPRAEWNDRAHELGTRALMAALDVVPSVLRAFVKGDVTPRPQDLSIGRVYRRRDFQAAAVRCMWENFDSGLMPEYVSHAASRCAAYPIVRLPDTVRRGLDLRAASD